MTVTMAGAASLDFTMKRFWYKRSKTARLIGTNQVRIFFGVTLEFFGVVVEFLPKLRNYAPKRPFDIFRSYAGNQYFFRG